MSPFTPLESALPDDFPAFPVPIAVGPAGDVYDGATGMSLRDYFAAQALLGLMDCNNTDAARAAGIAYHIADAMLAERARELNTTEETAK